MKSVLVKIQPLILDWIKSYIKENFSEQELLDELNTWDNINKPLFTDIEKMSKRIHIPFGQFVLDKPPKESEIVVEFRRLPTQTNQKLSLELRDTINNMKYLQSWMENYLETEGFKQLDFVGKARSISKKELINRAKNLLKIEDDWLTKFNTPYEAFTTLRKKLEDLGILVMLNSSIDNNRNRPFNLDEFRAFVLISNTAPLIFLNNKDNFEAKIFSLLHEFVHILLGQNDLFNNESNSLNNKDEQLCNEIAANLIISDSLFNQYWNDKISFKDNIKNISNKFNVSLSVINRRALELNKITQQEYQNFQNKINNIVISNLQSKGGNYYNNKRYYLDNRFKEAIINSINDGNLSYTEAFRLTGTNNTTFDEIVKI